jgi:hypothetical protein
LEVLMELDKDFNEFVELFLEHNVRFLIVGGYALAAHGLPRATGDLDAWEKRIMVSLNGMNVPFIGRDDLITNKKAAGRPQDIADVYRLTSEDK